MKIEKESETRLDGALGALAGRKEGGPGCWRGVRAMVCPAASLGAPSSPLRPGRS